MKPVPKISLSGIEKTAILLNVIGKEKSFELMKSMKDSDVRKLLKVMGNMKKAPIRLINSVLREYLYKLSEKEEIIFEENLTEPALVSQGLDPHAVDINWEEVARSERPRAVRDVQASFLLERIADLESISISNTEIEAAISRMASQLQEPVLHLKRRLTKDGALDSITNELRNRRALELVVRAAVVDREVVDGES